MQSEYLKVTKWCLFYRFFYSLLCLTSHCVLPHFDRSSDNFLNKWDAVFFRNITVNGYMAEHHLAFFPLLPLIVRFLGFKNFFTLVFYVINTVISIINSLILYKIANEFIDKESSKYAVFFYICNPASIVMNSFYTEPLFMLVFLLCLHYLLIKDYVKSAFMISLSCICRSNGILFLYLVFRDSIAANLLYCLIVCSPISIYQLYCLSKIFNFYKHNANLLNYDMTVVKLIIKPFIPYMHIQKKYWNQGFLKFYTVANIPNLLIGLPFVTFSMFILLYKHKMTVKNEKLFDKLCNILHMQTALSLLSLHLNMYFRFISYNPALYIIMGYLRSNNKNRLLFFYFKYYFAFSIAYAVLFGAFYPPA